MYMAGIIILLARYVVICYNAGIIGRSKCSEDFSPLLEINSHVSVMNVMSITDVLIKGGVR